MLAEGEGWGMICRRKVDFHPFISVVHLMKLETEYC